MGSFFLKLIVANQLTFGKLQNLLELKQKQANAWEARFAREQAEETTRQGIETTRQGKVSWKEVPIILSAPR